MSFLKNIYNTSNNQANIEVCKIGKEAGINLLIGDNFGWLDEDEFEAFKEEGVLVNENLITLLENQGVEFSDILREDFHFMVEGEEIEIYLKDESGLYSTNIFLEYLEIGGVQNFEVWLDFNNLYKETRDKDLNDLSSEKVIKY